MQIGNLLIVFFIHVYLYFLLYMYMYIILYIIMLCIINYIYNIVYINYYKIVVCNYYEIKFLIYYADARIYPACMFSFKFPIFTSSFLISPWFSLNLSLSLGFS